MFCCLLERPPKRVKKPFFFGFSFSFSLSFSFSFSEEAEEGAIPTPVPPFSAVPPPPASVIRGEEELGAEADGPGMDGERIDAAGDEVTSGEVRG